MFVVTNEFIPLKGQSYLVFGENYTKWFYFSHFRSMIYNSKGTSDIFESAFGSFKTLSTFTTLIVKVDPK